MFNFVSIPRSNILMLYPFLLQSHCCGLSTYGTDSSCDVLKLQFSACILPTSQKDEGITEDTLKNMQTKKEYVPGAEASKHLPTKTDIKRSAACLGVSCLSPRGITRHVTVAA